MRRSDKTTFLHFSYFLPTDYMFDTPSLDAVWACGTAVTDMPISLKATTEVTLLMENITESRLDVNIISSWTFLQALPAPFELNWTRIRADNESALIHYWRRVKYTLTHSSDLSSVKAGWKILLSIEHIQCLLVFNCVHSSSQSCRVTLLLQWMQNSLARIPAKHSNKATAQYFSGPSIITTLRQKVKEKRGWRKKRERFAILVRHYVFFQTF